jgi:hypothetical protein
MRATGFRGADCQARLNGPRGALLGKIGEVMDNFIVADVKNLNPDGTVGGTAMVGAYVDNRGGMVVNRDCYNGRFL